MDECGHKFDYSFQTPDVRFRGWVWVSDTFFGGKITVTRLTFCAKAICLPFFFSVVGVFVG